MRAARVLAWALWLVSVTAATGGLLLSGGDAGVLATIVVGFSTVGALVGSRHPRNPIGWVFSLTGLVAAVQALALAWAVYSLPTPALVRGGVVAAWIQEWAWIPLIGLPSVVVLLLFPDGRLPSRRWRPVLWTGLGAMGAACFGFALKPGPLTNEARLAGLSNPFGLVPGADTIGLVAFVMVLVTALVAIVSQVVRYRSAGGEQRLQIKWFAYAGTLMGTIVVVGSALWQVSPTARQLVPLSLVLGPIGAGMGVLRYRLYDIDRLINLTLLYGALTGLLTIVYGAAILVLSRVGLGFGSEADLGVAASVLLVAALFRPGRDRLQRAIDRRFYRSRYDAARTLEQFGSRLRQQVDAETLRAELLTVAGTTLRPIHVSLWLAQTVDEAETLMVSNPP